MKDYYRILQVSPEADRDEVTSAYKRLIRKYHPDSLEPEKRDDPDIMKLVQDLNAAYEILGNEEKRSQYDEPFRWYKEKRKPIYVAKEIMEFRLYLIRCGKTKRTFEMHLTCTRGSKTLFVVIGIEQIEDFPQIVQTVVKRGGVWRRMRSALLRKRESSIVGLAQSNNRSTTLFEDEMRHLFDESISLSMGDIDWNGYACPDCGSVIKNANGTLATWTGCSKCGHIKCVGSVEKTRRGVFSTCPWCGKRNKVTRSVPLGKKDHLSLGGRLRMDALGNFSASRSYLEGENSKKLGSGNR